MPFGAMGTLVFKRIPATAITAGTPLAVWTPTSGKKFRLMGYTLGSTIAAAQAATFQSMADAWVAKRRSTPWSEKHKAQVIASIRNHLWPLAAIPVAEINAAADRVKSAGGKVLNGPMDVPGGSKIVQCQDPQGAFFALVAPGS